LPDIRRDWVTLAILLHARGIRGEIAADGLGSKPERYETVKTAWIFGADESAPLRQVEIEEVWEHKGGLVFKLRGVDSMDDAKKLEKTELRIPASERPPAPEGEFYHSDLIGCDVFLKDGALVGQVTGWEDHGAAGLLVVNKDVLIPFASAICVEIDVAGRRIVIDPPEGLLDQS
jgi:16S rRNA processing protein RimM